MTESAIYLIIAILVLGQIYAVKGGRDTALIYYIIVAPLGYFQAWMLMSIDPSRLCGIVIIVASFFWRINKNELNTGNAALFLVLGLVPALTTFVLSPFWPIESMTASSPIYSYLRGLTQVINWAIVLIVGWNLSLSLQSEAFRERFSKAMYGVSFLHALYAFYQCFAYRHNLPMTGIRRVAQGVSEGYATYYLHGEAIFRPGSLIGEPKFLGAACVFWIALIITDTTLIKQKMKYIMLLVLNFTVLALTSATSAWGVEILFLCVFFASGPPKRFIYFSLLIAMVAIIIGVIGLQTDLTAHLNARLFERISDPLADKAEIETIKFMQNNVEFLLLGTGLGGISFFLAQSVNGSRLLLTPNNGLLALLCDQGFAGLMIIGSILVWWLTRHWFCRDQTSRRMAVVGISMLFQNMVFSQPYLFAIMLGFLGTKLTKSMTGKEESMRESID